MAHHTTSILWMVLLFLLVTTVVEAQGNSTNLVLPSGYSNHGDPKLLCRPTKWSDIALFFLGDYVAHAATIKTIPGQRSMATVIMVVSALLFPTTGVVRSTLASVNMPILAKTSLRTAARAGALCTVMYDAPSGSRLGYSKQNRDL